MFEEAREADSCEWAFNALVGCQGSDQSVPHGLLRRTADALLDSAGFRPHPGAASGADQAEPGDPGSLCLQYSFLVAGVLLL